MKFKLIAANEGAIPVAMACAAMDVSPQGFSKYKHRLENPSERQSEDMTLQKSIEAAHKVGRETYGTPRLKMALAEQGIVVSRRRIGRLCKVSGISVKTRRAFVNTTDSRHSQPIAENVLNRKFTVETPNQVWVSDITYIRVATHWLYLCTVTDLFSNVVVGRKVSPTINAALVVDAMTMAIRNRHPSDGCLFHSDRGSQYASSEVRGLLSKHRFVQSMSRRANCWDNAVAESSFSRLKGDIGDTFESDLIAANTIYEYLDVFHNYTRIHTRVGTTPVKAEERFNNSLEK